MLVQTFLLEPLVNLAERILPHFLFVKGCLVGDKPRGRHGTSLLDVRTEVERGRADRRSRKAPLPPYRHLAAPVITGRRGAAFAVDIRVGVEVWALFGREGGGGGLREGRERRATRGGGMSSSGLEALPPQRSEPPPQHCETGTVPTAVGRQGTTGGCMITPYFTVKNVGGGGIHKFQRSHLQRIEGDEGDDLRA